MSKDGFNQAVKDYNDEVELKTKMKRGSRTKLKMLAGAMGKTMGEYIEYLAEGIAEEELAPVTMRREFEREGIEYTPK